MVSCFIEGSVAVVKDQKAQLAEFLLVWYIFAFAPPTLAQHDAVHCVKTPSLPLLTQPAVVIVVVVVETGKGRTLNMSTWLARTQYHFVRGDFKRKKKREWIFFFFFFFFFF